MLMPSLVVMLGSCEGTTTHEWRVVNASSVAIEVEPAFSSLVVHEPSRSIAPGGEAVIGHEDDIRGGNSDAEVHLSYVEHITIVSSEGDTATRNGTIAGDWTSSSDHKRRMPSYWAHRHVMTVTDADLE